VARGRAALEPRGRVQQRALLFSPPLGQDRQGKGGKSRQTMLLVSTVILGGSPTMATWVVEVRLIGPNGESKTWQKELDQIKANQLYAETVETLRLRYPDVKP
jgi:hypothetical protein